jgi:hypothetical protein
MLIRNAQQNACTSSLFSAKASRGKLKIGGKRKGGKFREGGKREKRGKALE